MKVIKKISLLNCGQYTSGVYSNYFYKMINSYQKVIKLYNSCLNYIFEKETCDLYYAICLFKDSYIVSKKDINNKLFKISECFKEYEEIKLSIPKEYINTILSIYYDEVNNKILIATKSKVYSTTLDGYFIKNEFDCCDLFEKVEFKSGYIRELDGCCKPIQKKIEKCDVDITCVGLFCKRKYIGIVKDNSAYLLELSDNGNIIDKFYIDDNIKINSIINNNCYLTLLITKDEKYNYIYFLDKKCCYKKEDKKNYKCNCKKAKCDLIESIALMETALSHILNSEGEKLQKVLKETDDICDILKINDSINKTIMNITMLEQILYEKLKLTCKEEKNK